MAVKVKISGFYHISVDWQQQRIKMTRGYLWIYSSSRWPSDRSSSFSLPASSTFFSLNFRRSGLPISSCKRSTEGIIYCSSIRRDLVVNIWIKYYLMQLKLGMAHKNKTEISYGLWIKCKDWHVNRNTKTNISSSSLVASFSALNEGTNGDSWFLIFLFLSIHP